MGVSLVAGVYTSKSAPTITGPLASILYNGDSGSSVGNAGYQTVPTAGTANFTWTVSAPSGDRNALAAFVPAAAAPVITATSPADNATGVLVTANLVANFSEPVVKGTGTITLKRTSNNSTVESFNVASSPNLVFSGQTLTINPTNDLGPGVAYHLLIDSTSIVDTSGGNTFTFTHPQNASLAADLRASYRWSTNLAAFHLGGQTSGGTTVNFTTEANTPSPGFTRVTATVTGTLPDRLFLDVRVTGP